MKIDERKDWKKILNCIEANFCCDCGNAESLKSLQDSIALLFCFCFLFFFALTAEFVGIPITKYESEMCPDGSAWIRQCSTDANCTFGDELCILGKCCSGYCKFIFMFS